MASIITPMAGGVRDVSTACDIQIYMEQRRHLGRTMMHGTFEMRRQGTRYLPQEPKESVPAYERRLHRTVLKNQYKKTVKSLSGRPFNRNMKVESANTDIVDAEGTRSGIVDNVDKMGHNAQTFAQMLLEDGLVNGLSFLHVEMPKRPLGMTLAQQREQKIYPYFVKVEARNLLGWKAGYETGAPVLKMVRFYEQFHEDADEFHVDIIQQIRVLDLVPTDLGMRCRFRVFRLAPKTAPNYAAGTVGAMVSMESAFGPAVKPEYEWKVYDEGIYSLDYIPFFPFYADESGFMEGYPPLEDLAYMNLTHWQSYSDQRNILHVARVPILFGKGFDKDEDGKEEVSLEVGANIAIYGPPDSDLKYVEHNGAAISAGADDLRNLEADMLTFGLEFLMTRPDRETATGRMIEQGEVNSPLKRIVDNLLDCLENAFKAVANYLDDKNEPKVKIMGDLGFSMRDSATLANLIEARKNGDISLETFLTELQRMSILRDDLSITDEITRIQKEQSDAAALVKAQADEAAARQAAVAAASKPAPGDGGASPPPPGAPDPARQAA